MKVSIIIPVFNGLAFTKDALRRLFEAIAQASSTDLALEVVLVDDGSNDGTEEWVRRNFQQVHICKGSGNLWWSGSVNLGMEFALNNLEADFIIWWNNDIYPAPDYFANLSRLLASTDCRSVFGSKIYVAEKPDLIWSVGGYFHRFWGHSYMPGSYKPDAPEYNNIREPDWLAGMGTILPRTVIEKVGMLNTNIFPQYHGDIDYTCRARLAGFKIEVRPELKIWNYTSHSGISHEHKINRLFPILRDTKSLYNFRKELLLYKKYARNPMAYLMLIKKYAGYFVKFLLYRKRN